MSKLKLIECPRDAMQGLHDFIPTNKKVEYINALLQVGFDTIDFGSFVSPKAIPQLADTKDVMEQLDLSYTDSKLLAIIANERGANDAIAFEQIQYLGFPFSISPTFQKRNTNASQAEAFDRIQAIQELCVNHNKEMVVYLSMAFGNPYGDPWTLDEIGPWVEQFEQIGISTLALADTVGVAEPDSIDYLFSNFIPYYPELEFGAHFHSRPDQWKEKIQTAFDAGCTRFDSTIHGIGGCPMADDKLVGNIATENLLHFAQENEIELQLNSLALEVVQNLATHLFL